MRVRVESLFAPIYRRPGTELEGLLVGMSPSRAVARVRFDDVADSYIRTEHLLEA